LALFAVIDQVHARIDVRIPHLSVYVVRTFWTSWQWI
jgi:hypothetical protein